MNKLNKIFLTLVLTVLLGMPVAASAYTIDTTYQLTLNEGDSRRAANKFIVLHEVGTESSALNNAIYMKRAWSTNQAYTQFIVGDGGKVYKVGEDGYVSWGAGSYMNANSPVQIELARTFDKGTFNKDYAAYINLTRDYAIKYGIPLTLDDGNMYTNGIKTHLWVTQNVWGDHTDPYGYLARFGITKAQLAADLRNGIQENNTTEQTKASYPLGSIVVPLNSHMSFYVVDKGGLGYVIATNQLWEDSSNFTTDKNNVRVGSVVQSKNSKFSYYVANVRNYSDSRTEYLVATQTRDIAFDAVK